MEVPAKKAVKSGDRGNRQKLYSAVVKNDLNVFIQGQKGSLSRNQIAEIREKICDAIDGIPSGTTKPTFDNISTVNGMLHLACADAASKTWLVSVIETLACSDGTSLRHSTDPATFELIKMSVKILDSKNASAEKIFRRFQDQNSGLDVSKWTFFRELESHNPSVRHILLGVDQESKDFITNRGKRLHYMLQAVKVDIRGKSKGSAAEKDNRT